MDKRKCKRIALVAGLFFLFFVVGVFFIIKAERQRYEETAAQMEVLTEKMPDSEAEFAGVLSGKYAEDNYENKDDGGTENTKKEQIEAGEKLLEKYGYDFGDSLQSGIVVKYVGGMVLILLTILLSCGIFAWYNLEKRKMSIEREDYLKEKLKEEKLRNQRMESALRQEEQETKAMITDISHQLKTPVASLRVSYEIEDSTELSAEEKKEFREKEKEDVRRLEHLLQAFTQMTRLETGMIRLHPEKESLKATLAKAVAGVYVSAMDKGIQIEMKEFSDMDINHDLRWTAEAFGNVLDNGVKYSPPGTCITIRVSEMVSFIMIEIEDEGPGIPVEERTKIFQRFYRGESEMVRRMEGSGVGLYLTRRILEQQGGTVCVKAGRSGGSIFVMTLPKQ